MLNIKTTSDKEAFVDISGSQTEIITELASVVGSILTRPEFTEASVKTFDSFYKRAIKIYKEEKEGVE